MNIKALKDWIWIKELPLEETTKSGLLIDFIKGGEKLRGDAPIKGRVVAVSDKWKDKIPLESTVLYLYWNGGWEVPISPTEELFVTKPENVWAVIDEGN